MQGSPNLGAFATRSTAGTYTEDVVSGTDADFFSLIFGTGVVAVIDNVSLKKVL